MSAPLPTRTQILNAMAAALADAGYPVERSRTAALAKNVMPCIVVRPKEEQGQPLGGGIRGRDFSVELQIHARGGGVDDVLPDDESERVIHAAHQALMADPTLGGLAAGIIERGSGWEFADADGAAVQLSVIYGVQYVTQKNQL